jgi:hypothetical protein
LTRPGTPLIDSVQGVWRGSRPRWAAVVSPFFDVDETENLPTRSLVAALARRGGRFLSFVVPVDRGDGSPILQAPRSICGEVPEGVELSFCPYVTPETEDPRGLHGKSIALGSDTWTAVVIGSSNFTTAGLGLHPRRGHLEINVGFGAAAGSPIARHLRALFDRYRGAEVDLTLARWQPESDDEEPTTPVRPRGFRDCLLVLGETSVLRLRFVARQLPASWELWLPNGARLLTSTEWKEAGSPSELERPVPAEEPLFFLDVQWQSVEGGQRASWPINVSEPGRLPPPSELRHLPVRDLLAALASTRPIHEEIARLIERRESGAGVKTSTDLDPLRRYSSAGQLMMRTRRFSLALDGLRHRLERPSFTRDALEWRLAGPFGPLAIAKGLLAEQGQGQTLPGEVDFLLAELSRVVARISWHETGGTVSRTEIESLVASTLNGLRALRAFDAVDPRLRSYVDATFAEICS